MIYSIFDFYRSLVHDKSQAFTLLFFIILWTPNTTDNMILCISLAWPPTSLCAFLFLYWVPQSSIWLTVSPAETRLPDTRCLNLVSHVITLQYLTARCVFQCPAFIIYVYVVCNCPPTQYYLAFSIRSDTYLCTFSRSLLQAFLSGPPLSLHTSLRSPVVLVHYSALAQQGNPPILYTPHVFIENLTIIITHTSHFWSSYHIVLILAILLCLKSFWKIPQDLLIHPPFHSLCIILWSSFVDCDLFTGIHLTYRWIQNAVHAVSSSHSYCIFIILPPHSICHSDTFIPLSWLWPSPHSLIKPFHALKTTSPVRGSLCTLIGVPSWP